MAITKVPGRTDAAARPAAVVIPFPVHRAQAVPDPQARLARALESLNAALNNQREAVAAWRDVLKDLKSTTVNLDEGLQRYRASLRSLGSSVSALQTKARALEAWADQAGAVSTGPSKPNQVAPKQASLGQASLGQASTGRTKI